MKMYNWLKIILVTCILIITFYFDNYWVQSALASPQLVCPQNMVGIKGGTFRMGSDDFFPEEKTVDHITVDDFCIDKTEVTNAQFAQFVQKTGYVTVAERPLSKQQFPDLADNLRAAGSLVFKMPKDNWQKVTYLSWWHWTVGANWRHPYGLDSDIEGKENYPVVHIAYEDAQAYAQWNKKSLPTEAQWEYAARGGLKDKIFSWGNEYSAQKANTWQGHFPLQNTQEDGYLDTAPVASFPANGYGLYDLTGNVWEWTSDWYSVGHKTIANQVNPQGPEEKDSFDPKKPDGAKHVIKGGSYLCAKNYCSRYRPAARESQSPDTGTTHIGFRLVTNPQSSTVVKEQSKILIN